MLPFAAVALGALIGFVASRKLRRPQNAAQAASVARAVSGSVGARRTLTAPELQRACFSEMVRHVRVDRQGRTRAASRYTLKVNPVDLEVIEETKAWFTDGLRDALLSAAKTNGWEIDRTIAIRYEADAARRPGVPSALAVEPDRPKQADSGPATVSLVRTDTGQRTVLGDRPVALGRSTDASIVIDDTRVSRTHASIERSGAGWTIVDLGSSNGTAVNDVTLRASKPQVLRAGDVIGIGPVNLRVESTPAPSQGETRALDDRDRTRISGEVLPPPRRAKP